MTLNVHYCCGKIKKVDWFTIDEKKCGNEEKMGSMPCCQNKQVIVKPIADYCKNDFLFNVEKTIFQVDFPLQTRWVLQYPKNDRKVVSFRSPPLGSPPLFLLYRVFKI